MKQSFFLLVVIFLLNACSSNIAADKISSPSQQTAATLPLVVVEKAGLNSQIKLPAQLAAFEEVSIFPKVNGYVKSVLVDIGSRVSKGNLLMVLDAPELQQAALQAKEKYSRSRADFTIDKEHYQRYLQASATAGAISPLDLSTLKAKMESDSAVCNAEKANWQMQETMLGYLQVLAPFNGVITERNVHPGALVSAAEKAKPMLELKEIDHLRLQVDVPEDFASGLKEKDTVNFTIAALQGTKWKGIISRRSNNVNTQYRTERIEIDVPNNKGLLSSGMYADVVVDTKSNVNALTVPKTALVISTERKYVLLARNGSITKLDVSTGNETAGKIEIFGNLQAGDSVIALANDEIKEKK
jgi:membrane fusion protein, multidrug efflux system